MRLILLGAPGSGKGTQAVRLSDYYHIPHISTGNILRQEIDSKTQLGKVTESYIKQGNLVPDEIIIRVIEQRIQQTDTIPGFIFDGFPRTYTQAKSLEQFLDIQKQSIHAVIYLRVAETTLIARISNRRVCNQCQAVYHLLNHPPKQMGKCDACGGELIQRPDDSENTIRQRLKIYIEQTEPLLDFYQQKDLLIVIDGENDADSIFNTMLKEISNR